MGIGQLLKNIVAWLQRWLRSIQKKAPQPFVSIREKQYPLGVLKLVEGRDTSHAVRTWIICPKSGQESIMAPLDLHVYLDFLGGTDPLASGSNSRNRSNGTHMITILRASRRLQSDGTYRYDHIFSSDYDFQGQHSTPADVQARIACDRIAVLAGIRPIAEADWPDEIEEIYRQVMGREGLTHTQAFKFWRKKASARSLNLPSTGRTHSRKGSSMARSSPRSSAGRYSMNNARTGKRKPQ